MGRNRGHIPIRTCIACGAKRKKGDLIRFVLDKENRLVRDDGEALPGRGAYLCDNPGCRERLLSNVRLERVFRGRKAVSNQSNL
ncbi:MAG: YlxR family protein [Deltaproteobacteria bacterium]|nr:YlxR family protein [Deltaproteobacteria bacterium]